MSAQFDIRPIVQKATLLPFEQLTVVVSLSELRLPEIQLGIVFVFAAWSGPARQAFHRFTRLLSKLERGSLDIIILDIDCMEAEDCIQIFGHVFSGAGETLWIRDGKVVAEVLACAAESEPMILSHTRDLLSPR